MSACSVTQVSIFGPNCYRLPYSAVAGTCSTRGSSGKRRISMKARSYEIRTRRKPSRSKLRSSAPRNASFAELHSNVFQGDVSLAPASEGWFTVLRVHLCAELNVTTLTAAERWSRRVPVSGSPLQLRETALTCLRVRKFWKEEKFSRGNKSCRGQCGELGSRWKLAGWRKENFQLNCTRSEVSANLPALTRYHLHFIPRVLRTAMLR